jgi:hypothetical protein
MSDNILGPEVNQEGKKGVAVIPPTLHCAPNPLQVFLKFDPTYASIF